MRVLAGDIGGTKTAVAIVDIGARRLSLVRAKRYPSAAHASLEEILADFLSSGRTAVPRFAGFGVAGPVVDGRSKVTKLPWTIDERAIARRLKIPRVRVVNDFVAAALGIPYLTRRQVVTIAEGDEERGGPVALIGAGTGLGQAGLVHTGHGAVALASEGGHADFGPRSPQEDRLLRFARRRFGRVDRDRLVCGSGLVLIYEFLRADRAAPESKTVLRAFSGEDRAAVITRFALAKRDPLCGKALAMFVSIYGSEAGNLAIQYRATGGLYVGGGIAPRILPALRTGRFLAAIRDKPPMEALLSRIPVRIVREPRLGLYGAAAAAYRMATETTRPSTITTRRPRRR